MSIMGSLATAIAFNHKDSELAKYAANLNRCEV